MLTVDEYLEFIAWFQADPKNRTVGITIKQDNPIPSVFVYDATYIVGQMVNRVDEIDLKQQRAKIADMYREERV